MRVFAPYPPAIPPSASRNRFKKPIAKAKPAAYPNIRVARSKIPLHQAMAMP